MFVAMASSTSCVTANTQETRHVIVALPQNLPKEPKAERMRRRRREKRQKQKETAAELKAATEKPTNMYAKVGHSPWIVQNVTTQLPKTSPRPPPPRGAATRGAEKLESVMPAPMYVMPSLPHHREPLYSSVLF
eukprot:TRINITY_DN51420_c1_g2_i1.p1 TRINITY_DN51420_c1_g2~~TRINITY_DN51420_c1_g2_i1.p1  ORF type:complete len:134 (-),score=24.28 TRINITY_DN51420_c1_g2_i1:517-918(-)